MAACVDTGRNPLEALLLTPKFKSWQIDQLLGSCISLLLATVRILYHAVLRDPYCCSSLQHESPYADYSAEGGRITARTANALLRADRMHSLDLEKLQVYLAWLLLGLLHPLSLSVLPEL